MTFPCTILSGPSLTLLRPVSSTGRPLSRSWSALASSAAEPWPVLGFVYLLNCRFSATFAPCSEAVPCCAACSLLLLSRLWWATEHPLLQLFPWTSAATHDFPPPTRGSSARLS